MDNVKKKKILEEYQQTVRSASWVYDRGSEAGLEEAEKLFKAITPNGTQKTEFSAELIVVMIRALREK